MPSARGGIPAVAYVIESPHSVLRAVRSEIALEDVELVDGDLVGSAVSVESRCVLVATGADDALYGCPMEPLQLRDGGLRFDPSGGGIRERRNRDAAGAFNTIVDEAARFGMVNSYFHATHVAGYFNHLLREIGTPPLPPVHVVVSAHAGSKLPGYCSHDGDCRRELMYPFQGGHYRVSTLTTGIPEPVPVRPNGEIHLGPGIRRAPFAGEALYLRNAAHNPMTIYHEYGHHLCHHTADFRLNRERAPERQRNGKTGPEEGVCDYVVATLLGTGRPYGWYRPTRGAWRDPETVRTVEAAHSDPHAVGAAWASALWHTRQALLHQELIGSPRDHDRALIEALLTLGSVASRPGDRRRRPERATTRSAPETITAAYFDALRARAGVRASDAAARIFTERGLLTDCAADGEASPC